ncbi:tetratricopeptide repeat protein [Chitinimonas sp.]|uniref:tetratricopeptide repeat protein n=1 Tax=Chitinimonas sp. TaxID=1934313 RepID=UPI002F92CDF6
MPTSLSSRTGLSLLLAALLAACATPVAPPAPATTAAAVDDDNADDAAGNADEQQYPKQAMTPDLLFGFLVGDFAANTGNKALAADTWLELARRTRDPRAAERAVETSFQAGKAEDAIAATRLWRELAPDNLRARQTQLSVLARTGQLKAAEAELDQWFTERPADVPALLMQMHSFWAPQTDRRAVLAMTQRLAGRYPKLPEASLSIALAASRAGDVDTALAASDTAIQLRPGWETAILFRATLTDARSPEEAADYLRAAVQRQPKSRDLRSALAQQLSGIKRFDECYAVYGSLAKDYPDEVEYTVGLAQAAIQVQRYAEAETALERALTLGVAKPQAIHYYLGLVTEEQGKLPVALKHYREIEDGEHLPAALTRIARIEAKLGHQDAALAAVNRLPTATGADQVARIQLEAQIWRELKQLDKAREALDVGLAKHADSADLLYDRSLIYDQQGDLDNAERDLRRYLTLKPDSPIGLNALGYTLANRSTRFEEAESLLQKALSQEPDNPVIIDSMGWLQYRRGNLAEAVKWLSRAFTTLRDPEIAAHYGEALWQSGKHAEARKIWEEGKKLDPGHEVLSETVQRLTTGR